MGINAFFRSPALLFLRSDAGGGSLRKAWEAVARMRLVSCQGICREPNGVQGVTERTICSPCMSAPLTPRAAPSCSAPKTIWQGQCQAPWGSLRLPSSPEGGEASEKLLETIGGTTPACSTLPSALVRFSYYGLTHVESLLEWRSESRVDEPKAACLSLGRARGNPEQEAKSQRLKMPRVVQTWGRQKETGRESVFSLTRAVEFPAFAISGAYAALPKCCHWEEEEKKKKRKRKKGRGWQ